MKKIRYRSKKSTGIFLVNFINIIIFIIIPFSFQLSFVAVAHAQFQFNEPKTQTASAFMNEIEVGTPAALQEALNGEIPVIKIKPGNGRNDFILDKALTISASRNVSLVADSAVNIIGAGGQWQFIINPDIDVTIHFNNITLDGNNTGCGIYNQGTLTLENAEIKNCFNSNGGAGIYSIGNLTVNGSKFRNNIANTNSHYDGGAIYARGLDSRISVNVTNSLFENNSARYGGAVRFDNTAIQMVNCELTGNTAIQGPAVYAADAADLNVTNCTLTKNAGSGAIFVNNSALTATDCSISNNDGQGIYGYADGGNAEITIKGHTVVSGNAAKTSYGGGISGYTWGASETTINLRENAVVSGNEAVNGGGVSSYPESNVIINMSENAQVINNKAYENGGGIYGDGIVSISGGRISSNTAMNGGGIYSASGTGMSIWDTIISDNTAGLDGGGIWIANLNELTANNLKFQNNSASAGYFWRFNAPADEKQMADAATHKERILNTSYTTPYTNAYNNYDINYTSDIILLPYMVTYNGNNNDSGTIPTAEDNPYLAGEKVTVLVPPDSLAKANHRFVGWNTKPDGSGTHYVYNEEHVRFQPQAFTMGNENVILYAQWEKIENLNNLQPKTLTNNQEKGAMIADNEVLPEDPPDYELFQKEPNTIYWIVFIGVLILSGLFLYFFLIFRRHITREEFVRMIIQAVHLETDFNEAIPYTDVSEDAKYYEAIMKAKAAGLLSGFSGNKFQPVSAVTREEMASILAKTIRYGSSDIAEEKIDLKDTLKDFDSINEIFLDDIRLIIQLEIMEKKPDASFDPKGLSTRRQAKKIIKNMLAAISPD